MVLDWVSGEEGKGVDLRGCLRQGPLALRQALDFAIDICCGLYMRKRSSRAWSIVI